MLKAPRRWLLIRREMDIPIAPDSGGWLSLDHLFLDQDGIPTLVEVKRSSDSRIRREMVGQMLDYAANAVVYWPVAMVRARFEATHGENAEQVLLDFLGEGDPDEFWKQAEENLKNGKVRLLFVADMIPPELQRVVEFLNGQMSPAEVLAVEIKQYSDGVIQTLVPRVLGQSAKAEQKKGAVQKRLWDEVSYFEALFAQRGEIETLAARRIYDWACARVTRIWFGKGATMGSFVPVFHHNKVDHQLFAIYTGGSIEVYFQYYQYKKPFEDVEKRRELRQRLNTIDGVFIPENGITRRPVILLSQLNSEEKIEQLLSVFEWVIAEIGQAG
jgi:hypothetical protein